MPWWLWIIVTVVAIAVILIVLVLLQYQRYRHDMPRPPYQDAMHSPDIRSWSHDAVSMTWVGHSTMYIRLFDVGILTDVVLFSHVGVRIFPGLTFGPKRYTGTALDPAQLDGQVNLLLLSHAHLDHLDIPSIRSVSQGNEGLEVVTAKHTARLLKRFGFRKVWEVGGEDQIETTLGVRITAVPVRHWGARFPWNRDYHWTGYVIEYRGIRILFAGDTAKTGVFREIGRRNKPIHVTCMPIGAYSPDTYQGSHCTPEQAWSMFVDSGAEYLVPMHWKTFVLSQEPVEEPIRRLFRAAGDEASRIVIREPGEEFHLDLQHGHGQKTGNREQPSEVARTVDNTLVNTFKNTQGDFNHGES